MAAVSLLATLTVPMWMTSASAYQYPTADWDSDGSAVITSPGPSGNGITITTTGATAPFGVGSAGLGSRGYDQAHFSPAVPSEMPAADIATATDGCTATAEGEICADRGTITIAFDHPVRNPVLHLTGLGGQSGAPTGWASYSPRLTLTTPGASLDHLAGPNLSVTDDTIHATDNAPGVNCTAPGASGNPAACGSVQVNGIVSSLTFDVELMVTNQADAQPGPDTVDAYLLAVSVPEDFGDAPASYDEGDAARHVLSDVVLGNDVTADNTDVANATESPHAGPDADGDADDAFDTLPPLPGGASAYSLDVPYSGASAAAWLCGWIDFDANDTFEEDERACGAVEPGAGTVNLTWSGIETAAASETYARFRIGYTQSQVESPTGPADSGEVEDYLLQVTEPRLAITKSSSVVDGEAETGDTVTYTVAATNVGDEDATEADPVTVADDLAGVLDDAFYDDNAGADQPGDINYDEPVLTWTGALAADETVTITYTVTLTPGGDGTARNVAWGTPGTPDDPGPAPACDPAEPDGLDPVTGLPCAEEEFSVVEVPARWQCPTEGILFQYPGSSAPDANATAVFLIDMVSGEFTSPFTLDGYRINAIAHNPIDDYVYGWDFLSSQLARIAADGSVTLLEVSGTMAGGRLTGDVDENGHYWVTGQGGSGSWTQIDLATLAVVNTGPIEGGGIGNFSSGPDWAYVPGGGDALYRVMHQGTTEAFLFRFDRSSGQHENLGSLGDLGGNNVFGAVYADPDGFLYASNNTTGVIWRIDIEDVTATEFAPGPSSANNDGARCINAPIPIDFGDAPDSYGTLLESDGARHAITGYDQATNTAPLMLGELIDAEPDGLPSPGADGDDLDGVNDEDGVADPIVLVAGSPTEVTVTVTNDTGEPATLAGWIDLDGNGTFDPAERQVVPVGNSGDYTLTFPPATTTDTTYARFRLYPGDVADPAPTGPASGGEVEDYPVQVAAHQVTKTADPDSGTAVLPGDTVTYAITVSNAGTTDLADLEVTDDLSDVIDDADMASDPTLDPPGRGTAEIVGTTLTWAGDLDAGQEVTITYAVTAGDPTATTGDGVLVNAVVGGQCPDPAIGDPDDDDFNPDCVTRHPVESYTVAKASEPGSGTTVRSGDTVEYTLAITNTGGADLDPTVFDDLSGVFDDATYNDDADATTGSVEVLGETLFWAGPLPAGEVATVTYSVTVGPDAELGNGVLGNVVTAPGSNCPAPAITDPDDPDFDPDCTTSHPVEALALAKVVSDADTTQLQPGDTFTYTITAANIGGAPLTGATFTDNLADVLDDAAFDGNANADLGSVAFSEPNLTWTADLDPGDVATITYSVTIDNPIVGNAVLRNAVTSNMGNCPPGGIDPRCRVVVPQPVLETTKTLLDPAEPQPDDTVTYQFVTTNMGDGDAIGVVVVDDLSGVLDDASYDGNATATSGSIDHPETGLLAWTGDLEPDESVTVTYTVDLHGRGQLGDGVLTNAITGGGCPTPAVLDPGDTDFDPGCVVIQPVPDYTVAKSASPAVPQPGDDVSYTITVTNTGGVDYTAADPATFSDDLGGVLDDATYNDDAEVDPPGTGTLDYTEPGLSWEGPLPVGETVTVNYTVTVDGHFDLVNGVLVNAVVGGQCPDPAIADPDHDDFDPDCVPILPIDSYTIFKEADPTDPQPGDDVTYTITVTNTGGIDYTEDNPATFSDDLGGVLDDATYNDDAEVDPPGTGTLDYTEPGLSWEGPLPVGETVTVNYTVTVDGPRDLVNGVLVNAVVGGQCPDPAIADPDHDDFDPDCVPILPVPAYTIVKTSDPADGAVQPGDDVTYTITVTNTGAIDLSPTVTDDLTGVLDDAVLVETAVDPSDAGTLDFTGPELSWTGDLDVGDTVTITYTVTVLSADDVDQAADRQLANVVTGDGPTSCPDPAVTDPADPDFDQACVPPPLPVREYQVTKAADLDEVLPGDTVEYTIAVTNTGGIDFTEDDPASFVDDLDGVLDDATYNDDAAIDPPGIGTVAFAEPMLAWEGELPVGGTVVVTYSVTIDDVIAGDHTLSNVVVTPSGPCVAGSADPRCTVDLPIPDLDVVKQADQTDVNAGDTVTYTIAVANSGAGDFTTTNPASFVDDLSGVLDDATFNDDAEVDPPGTGTLGYTDPDLSWSGPLASGETVTITYSVTIDDDVVGDAVLRNAVTTPIGTCVAGSDDPACQVTIPTPIIEATKTGDFGHAVPGGTAEYTITVANVGAGDFTTTNPASFVDDLSGVLDDATFNDDAEVAPSGAGTLDYTDPDLSWSGPLASGETVTITYSVTIDDPVVGDGILENRVITPTGNCRAGLVNAACTTSEDLPMLDAGKEVDVAATAPGDTASYTVTLTNVGVGDFTVDRPAGFIDDLSGVLDDAAFNDDATADDGSPVDYTEPQLSWSGPLLAGETVTITYSVTAHDPATGDGTLDNRIVTTTGSCVEGSTDPACGTETGVYGLGITKTSDADHATAGDTVTYTVAVTNTGGADYTDATPAAIDDDMTGVLDHATFDGEATARSGPEPTYAEPVLSWAGPLAVGDTVTITYRVVIDDAAEGDLSLTNVVNSASPGANCPVDDITEECETVTEILSAAAETTPPAGTAPPSPPTGLLPLTGADGLVGALQAAMLLLGAGLVLLILSLGQRGPSHPRRTTRA